MYSRSALHKLFFIAIIITLIIVFSHNVLGECYLYNDAGCLVDTYPAGSACDAANACIDITANPFATQCTADYIANDANNPCNFGCCCNTTRLDGQALYKGFCSEANDFRLNPQASDDSCRNIVCKIAPGTTFSISGRVYNSTGNVSGATVIATVTGETTPRETTTDIKGIFTFTGILYGAGVGINATYRNCQSTLKYSNGYLSENINDANLELGCNFWDISGYILDKSGIIVADPKTVVTIAESSSNAHFNADWQYYFTDIPPGHITITARTAKAQGSATTVCSGTTSFELSKDEYYKNITANDCCDATVTETACIDNVINVTTSSCGSNPSMKYSRPCTSLQPCNYKCTEWAPACTATQQTQSRTCTQDIVAGCNASIMIPKPPESQKCAGQCGDGFVNTTMWPPEECDYSVESNVLDVTRCAGLYPDVPVEYLNQNVCDMSNCTCRPPFTIPETPGEDTDKCIDDTAGSISKFYVKPVSMKHAFNNTWEIKDCANYTEKFILTFCDNTTAGNCLDNGRYSVVNDKIPKTARNYTHEDPAAILPNRVYCYNLTVQFNDSVNPGQRFRSSIQCVRSGDAECMEEHADSWCGKAKSSGTPRTIVDAVVSCSANNILQNATCSSDPANEQYCTMAGNSASCVSQGKCDACNSLFAILGYQGYRIPQSVNGADSTLFCPSRDKRYFSIDDLDPGNNEIDGCFADYTMSTIDKSYPCSKVSSCYDYKSKNACNTDGTDYCGKFTDTDEANNSCEWAPYISGADNGKSIGDDGVTLNTFNKGVCRPKDAEQQVCKNCNIAGYNRLYPQCVESIAKLYGTCYYNPDTGEIYGKDTITCAKYSGDENGCIGSNDETGIVVDVSYARGIGVSGTNTILAHSDDALKLGVCRWNYATEKCYRDADYNSNPDCDTNAALAGTCERDTAPPVSIIDSRPSYGMIIDLKGHIAVTDNEPWKIGDNTLHGKRNTIWIYYCVAGQGMYCYPNKVLPIIHPDTAYQIDLSTFYTFLQMEGGGVTVPIDARSNGKTFTLKYFAEDPAHNLEVVKGFDFILDTEKPDVATTPSLNTYRANKYQWLTNLTITLNLTNNEKSLPVECSFTLYPPDVPGARELFGDRTAYNIPSKFSIPKFRNNLTYQYDTLATKYPELTDGRYTYAVNCTDTAGNRDDYDGKIFIEGDARITAPKPQGQTYTTKTSNNVDQSLIFNKIISINTTADGTCKYSMNTRDYSSPLMNLFKPAPISGVHIYWADISSDIENINSGIFYYYVACNLTINNQHEIIRGDDADTISFAIDNLPPVATLKYLDEDLRKYELYSPAVPQADFVRLRIDCNDSNENLYDLNGRSKAFGCNASRIYYCIPLRDNTKENYDCSNMDKYINSSDILLNYTASNSADKHAYGNNPAIYYYAADNGNNAGSPSRMTINIQNMDFDDPIINITTIDGNVPPASGNHNLYKVNRSEAQINISYAEYSAGLNYTFKRMGPKPVMNTPLYPESGIITMINGQIIFSFDTGYMDNGNYTLKLYAVDDDNNTNNYSINITVKHAGNEVWLVSPLPLGISSNMLYDIMLGTIYNAECRYNIIPIPYATCGKSMSCKFDRYSSMKYTNGTTHLINYDISAPPFSNISVICRTINALNTSYEYFGTSFFAGNQSTPPHILDINITPYIIANTANAKIIIRVLTDQKAVCAITRSDGYNEELNFGIEQGNGWMYNDKLQKASQLEDNGEFTSYSNTHYYSIDHKQTILNILDKIDTNLPWTANAVCRNSILETGEQCEPAITPYAMNCTDFGYASGAIACTPQCTYDISQCTGATTQAQCTNTNIHNITCQDMGFSYGTINCNSGKIDTSQCIRIAFDYNITCRNYAQLSDNGLATALYQVPTPPKITYCGDNSVQKPNNNNLQEECDGTDLNEKSCTSFFNPIYIGGILGCYDNSTGSSACKFNFKNCDNGSGYCGNGIQEANSGGLHEQCDGTLPSGVGCTTFGFNGGILSCSNCIINTSACIGNTNDPPNCGDGILEPSEHCEGTTIRPGTSCATFGYSNGTISCSNKCIYDLARCYSTTTPIYIVNVSVKTIYGEILPRNNIYYINTSRANITIAYNKENITLRYEFQKIWPWPIIDAAIDSTTSLIRQRIFGIYTGDMDNGNHTLKLYATDANNNNITKNYTINMYVTRTANDIWLVSPLPLGISNNTPYDITLATTYRAECRYSTILHAECSNNLSCRYDSYNEMNHTNDTTHRIAYTRTDITPIYIVCRTTNTLNGEIEYIKTQIYGGVINTGVRITNITITPNPLRNISQAVANIHLATDQNAVCLINHTDVNYLGLTLSTFFSKEHIADFTSYSTIHDYSIDYRSLLPTIISDNQPPYPRVPSTPAVCNDGKLEVREQCDPTTASLALGCSDFGFSSGAITCTPQCTYNISGCSGATTQTQCTNTNTHNITCQDIGFSYGTINCNNNTLDTSQCIQITFGYDIACWNYAQQADNASITISYKASQSEINNIINGTNNPTNNTGTCGDSIIQSPNIRGQREDCDSANLGGLTCSNLGNYTGGILKCFSNSSSTPCKFDISNCDTGKGYCGNGRIEGPNSAGAYEQCDNDNLHGLDCQDFGFTDGTLRCSNCMLNSSQCRLLINGTERNISNCNNRIIESGELCEPAITPYALDCTDFSYDTGTTSCTSQCTYDLSRCAQIQENDTDTGNHSNCGNGKLNPGEDCDGSLGMSNITCKKLDNRTYIGGSVTCTSCHYNTDRCIKDTCHNGILDIVTETDKDCGKSCPPCALNKTCNVDGDCDSDKCANRTCVPNKCTNRVLDKGLETDIDCGGTCGLCALGKNCSTASDCSSSYCINGKCLANPCSNGLQDGTETDIDCGGTCNSCEDEKSCVVNSDCASDNCLDNVCAPNTSNPPASKGVSILLLIGAVMALGSIGYILYSTFAPKKPESHVSPGIIFNRPYVKSPESSRPQDSAMINKRKELREHERNQLFEKLGGDAETEEKSDDDLHVHERHLSGDKKIEMPAQRKTAVPITKPVPKENIFDKLRNILPKESQDISKVKDAKKDYAKDSKVFEKLSDISKAKESLATDISKISGAPKARISDALENIRNDKDAIKLFGELDRSKIMSNIFQDILSNLISSRTIGKSDVSRILFEYMDRNVLSKADVAKISKDLKLI